MTSLPTATGRITKHNTPRSFSTNSKCESAKAERIEMLHDEVNAENVGVTTTLWPLRIRARDLRAEYAKMWRCYTGWAVQPFLYDSPEGDGSDESRTENLGQYIQSHVRTSEGLRAKLMRSSEANARWIKSNKGGGVLKRQLRARSQAVVSELARRQREFDKAVPSSSSSGASALEPITIRENALTEKDNETYLPPAMCTNDIKFMSHDTDVEDVGVKKPSTVDKIITARTRAYN